MAQTQKRRSPATNNNYNYNKNKSKSTNKKSASNPNSKRGRPRKNNAGKNNNINANIANNFDNFDNSENSESFNSVALNIMPFILIILSVYITVCFFVSGPEDVGGIGVFTRNIFYGLLGAIAILVPVMTVSIAIFLKKDIINGFLKYRIIFSLICVILYAAMAHLAWKESADAGYAMGEIFNKGRESSGGGVFGGFLAETLRRCVGNIGAWIFTISLSIVFSPFLFGYTPAGLVKAIANAIGSYSANRAEKAGKDGYKRNIIVKTHDSQRRYKTQTHRYTIKSHVNIPVKSPKSPKSPKISWIDTEDPIDLKGAKSAEKNNKNNKKSGKGDNPFSNSLTEETENILQNTQNNKNNIENDVDELFAFIDNIDNKDSEVNIDIKGDEDFDKFDDFDPENLENIKSGPVVRDDEPDIAENNGKNKKAINFEKSKVFDNGDELPVKKEYKFPPISYLTKETSTANVDISGELKETAQKLIDTLASFNVKTKIYGFSRGPSITRYEIAPDSGVKVNSVVTLQNDISLNLAADVRIEAPIPGKSAIGVEVPNKTREIVYLRSLLEDPKFINAASRITIALGEDIAGNCIYSDIAKMPHLLIAGTTGSGKTICMHSIITSILYKATPNEVKMIMIDPKKVELNMYNGIPHLLVPVVSDPKKAAGALSWAVNQMEERYMLIEEKGVRDFRAYNETIADDPLTEPLSQIVIIIDELADLMLTAKENVEQSINRLAAKARAAGLHLIVATQRPSVDVITGLIKANIPTRMAFAVASQIDSKTIINMGGAEKLIGLGDMLYQPIGNKPIRVQGAFVSDKDVMNIAEFWKKQSDGEYDENILSEIEQEAARCNTKGGRGQEKGEETNADDEFRKDSMLKSAIEVAIDTGIISTSLLQTKLSLGYARAARIINTMEKMNLIGPFEGSKPRKVLITKQEFIEMTMNKDDFE